MSLQVGSKKTSQKAQTDPWDETIPGLKDLLARLSTGGAGLGGPTAGQTEAFDELRTNAGNPHAGDISKLATDAFATTSRAPQVEGAFEDLKRQLTPYINGEATDPNRDPNFQKFLTSTADDAQNRINSMFAGAGRDLSGKNQQAVARGVNQAQLPVLVDAYQRGEDRKLGAINTVFTGGSNAATTEAALDRDAFGTRKEGVALADSAIAARDLGANTRLNLEQQIKQMPVQELGQLAQILFGAAGLGQQSTGTAKTSTSGATFDIAKIISGLGTLGA